MKFGCSFPFLWQFFFPHVLDWKPRREGKNWEVGEGNRRDEAFPICRWR